MKYGGQDPVVNKHQLPLLDGRGRCPIRCPRNAFICSLLSATVICLGVYKYNYAESLSLKSLFASSPSPLSCQPPTNWSGDGKRKHRLPRALIVGIRKGGTRALLMMLQVHPCVSAVSREVHFFDREETWSLGLQWYREQFPQTTSYEVGIEKSPAYFVTPEVPQRINSSLPNVKVIVILRNPVERLLSDFMQMMSKNWGLTPTKAINLTNLTREELDDLKSRFVRRYFVKSTETPASENNLVVRSWHSAVKVGIYHEHLRRWWQYIAPERIAIVCAERFVRFPANVLKELARFLRLENSEFRWEDSIEFSKPKGFYCPKRHDLAVVRTKRMKCLGADKGRQHIRPPSILMKKLYDFYEPHNERLFGMLGKRCFWMSKA